MKKRDYRDYILDIIESVKEIESFTIDMTFEDFINDKKTINAVIRSIEVIGEATKQLSRSFRTQYPSIPWKKMAGMRDKLIHGYFGVDLEAVWQTVKRDLPTLQKAVKDILNKTS